MQASEALIQAKLKQKKAEESGDESAISNAAIEVDAASQAFDKASDEVIRFGQQVQGTTSDLQTSTAQAINMFRDLESGLQGLTSGSLKGVGQGFMQIDKLFNDGAITKDAGNVLAKGFQSLLGQDSKAGKALTEALGSTGMAGQIISAILGIFDAIAQNGVSGIITSLQDTVFGAVEGILDDVLSGDIIMKPIKNTLGHIDNILNTVSFGGFGKLTDSIMGGNAKETAEKISELTSSNEALKVSIDGLKDKIEGTNGSKSIQAYNEAIKAQDKYNGNLKDILDAQMRYSNNHHSNAHYWDLDSNSLKQINSVLGTSLKNTWSDFADLTADQMNDIRTHLPDIWSEMINQGKYGNRFEDDWNNYADQAGKVAEMTTQLHESLTQISFDSLRDSFVDALMDMDRKAEDFANDFEEYMMRSLLNFSIGDMLDTDMKEWYEDWAKAVEEGNGELTEKEIEGFGERWDKMVADGIKKRDEIASMTGYTGDSSSTSREASSKGFASMSQDSADELNGGFTAIRYTGEQIKQLTGVIQMDVVDLKRIGTSASETLTDLRQIGLDQVYYLKEINKNTNELYIMNDRVGAMEVSLKSVKSSLDDINLKGITIKK